MLQDFDKILTSLKENERSAFITIIAYSFVSYAMLLVSFDEFRQLEWYQEIISSVGLSIAVMTIGFSALPSIKGESDFYYTLVISIIIAAVFTVFEFTYRFGFITFPFIYILAVLLLWLPSLINPGAYKKEVRSKKKYPDGNSDIEQSSSEAHTPIKENQEP